MVTRQTRWNVLNVCFSSSSYKQLFVHFIEVPVAMRDVLFWMRISVGKLVGTDLRERITDTIFLKVRRPRSFFVLRV